MLTTAIALVALNQLAYAKIDEQRFQADSIIQSDIAILGAGASGTFAAVRLSEDYNLNVTVIEKDDHIGGHTHTYIDPRTKQPVDYGVLSYWDYGPAKDFFARLGVEIAPPPPPTGQTVYVDFETARNLSDYKDPPFPDILTSIGIYGNQSEKYNDILLPGYWNFPSGEAIPEDLLLPFGDFAQKYGIENFYPLLQVIAGVGVGGVRDIPTIYVMAFALGNPAAEGLLQSTTFVPKSGSNSELYEKAYARLQDEVLLSSCVTQAERDDDGVRLVVKSLDGKETLIKAKQLLVTAAPSVSNLASIDLDEQETAIFSSSTPRPLHVGIIETSAVPRNSSVQFISSSAVPDNYLDLYQDLDYDLKIQSTGPEGSQLFRALLESTHELSADEAKAYITAQLQKLHSAGTFTGSKQNPKGGDIQLDFKAFINHNSISWRLPAEELKAGFIQRLYALQGHRSTWYTGSLWATDFSSNVWAFTDTVLERMVQELR